MGTISDSEKKIFLEKPSKEWTYEYITSLVSDKYDKKTNKVIRSKYKANDTFTLNAGEYINKEKVETTLGSLIFNKIVVEPSGCSGILGYVNRVIDNGAYGDLTRALASAVLSGVISRDTMAKFLNLFENVGMRLHAALASSLTPNTFKPIPAVLKKRDELFKKYEKELSTGDTRASIKMAEIEAELIDMAQGILKNDPGMMMYASKANASFGNNYKNIFITKGAMYDPATGKTTIVKNCLAEGIEKETIPAFGTDLVTSSYSKAVDTAKSGYMSKSILAVMQSTMMDKDLYDCGSKATLKVKIENGNDYLYRFIVENGKLVQLTEKNIKSYEGKVVNMRSTCLCTSQKTCEVCTGSIPKKLEIYTIGLMSTMITGKFSNLSMKKFHDSTTKLTSIDINDLFLFE